MAPEPSTGRRARSPAPGAQGGDAGALAVLVAVGLAVHLAFVLGADALDSDRALVLLMARAFARGEFSLYFWEQNYMGALEPLLLTPLAWAGAATPVAAGAVGVALTAVLALFSVRLAGALGGARWVALLFWAVAPAVVVHHHVALYGARLAATALVVGAFAWSSREPSRGGWMGVGVLVGVAWFGDHLVFPWVLGILWLATARGGLGPVALGALPLALADTVAAALTPAAHLSGPNDPGGWLANLPTLFGTALPQLFGLLRGRGPSPLFEAPGPLLPPGWGWVAFALPGAVVLVALALTLWRRRAGIFGQAGDPRSAEAARALLVVSGAGLALFAVVGGGGDRWPARYLVPLWPAVAILASLAVARWRPRARPLALLAVLPAAHTLVSDPAWPRAADAPEARAEVRAVAAALAGTGAEAVWADYWDAYRMALHLGDTPPWIPVRIIDRRPALAAEAREARPAAYLLRPGEDELLAVLESARARGIRWVSDARVGPFRLVVLEAAAPGAELRNPPPPRWWQALAAVGAGLLLASGWGAALAARRLGVVPLGRGHHLP